MPWWKCLKCERIFVAPDKSNKKPACPNCNSNKVKKEQNGYES